MFDVKGFPVIDKQLLIGTCVRLPVTVDAERLRAEVAALPASAWGSSGGRVGVHRQAEALFLRGYAPAAGDLPVGDRPVLIHLPYARELVHEAIGERPLRCLLARLPAGAWIAPHVDQGAYFAKTVRVHVPVETHDRAYMQCDGETFVMQPGQVWALNNSALHAVWNAHDSLVRTHLICDYVATPRLLELLAGAERGLGGTVPEVDAFFASLHTATGARAAEA
jgi:hypothetical protein